MTRADTEVKVRELMTKVLGIPVPPKGGLLRATTPEWDSLSHVELVFLVEDTFSVNLEVEELGSLDDVQALVDAVQRRQP